MLKRTFLALSVAALMFTGLAQAQENATFVLRSGDKVSGRIVDMGGVGFTISVNGVEKKIPKNDVAAIDFSGGGNVSSADWAKVAGGTNVAVLKNGQTIEGQLYDIGGNTPKRVTFKTSSGDREVSAAEIARIILARPNNASAVAATSGAGSREVVVSGRQQWTPTGLHVQKGQVVTLSTTGEVQLSGDANDVATPDGAKSQRMVARAPIPRTFAGALIGRVGNDRPFGIGTQTSITMPASGQLFLGINDDSPNDNQGEFRVEIKTAGAAQ
jgi:hypothetical protein